MDYLIIAVATLSGLYFHLWLWLRFRRWMDRDLALSLVEGEQARAWMLEQLEEARRQKIPRRQLQAWLEQAAGQYRQP